MKKIIKRNLKLFIGIFIGIVISGITVYAINANEIVYKDTTVDQAIEDLYNLASSNFVYGTQTSSNYGSFSQVNLDFEPRFIAAIITTSNGYLRSCVYDINGQSTSYQRGGSLSQVNITSCVTPNESGFSWSVRDSSWGTQTLYYYAFK